MGSHNGILLAFDKLCGPQRMSYVLVKVIFQRSPLRNIEY